MKPYALFLLFCQGCSDHLSTYPTILTPIPPDATIRDAAPTGTGGARSIDGGRDASAEAGLSKSGGCSVDPVTKCPTPKPSYKNDVTPILKAKCLNCHSGTDANGPWPLTSLQEIVDWRAQFIQDVETCKMPPVDAGAPLSTEESATLLGWLVCGAPNN